MKRKIWRVLVLTLMGIGFVISISEAQTTNPSYFDSITNFQQNMAEIWKTRAFIVSSTIFGVFFAIQGSFNFYRVLSPKYKTDKDIWDKFKTMFIIWVILLVFYQLENIIFGLRDIALFITGEDQAITEMGMLQEGFQIALNAGKPFEGNSWWGYLASSWNGMLTGGVYWLSAWMIFFAYGAMALQYAYITIEIMIVLAIGPIPLMFGGLEFTRGVAESYISDLIELGFKVFLFYFVFGISRTILSNVANVIVDGSIPDFGEAWWLVIEIAFIAILSVGILLKIPGPKAKSLCRHLNPKFEDLF
jgi:hypothetical protein